MAGVCEKALPSTTHLPNDPSSKSSMTVVLLQEKDNKRDPVINRMELILLMMYLNNFATTKVLFKGGVK